MTKQECTVQFSIVSGIPSFWGDKTVRKGQQWSDCMWWRQNLDVLPVQPLYISKATSRRWIPQKQQPSLLWARRAAPCFVLLKFVISHHLRELGGKGNLSAICWWLEEATLHATVPASLRENPFSSGLWSSAKPEAHESGRPQSTRASDTSKRSGTPHAVSCLRLSPVSDPHKKAQTPHVGFSLHQGEDKNSPTSVDDKQNPRPVTEY